jgi:phosphoglycolate phosphatase
MQRLSTYLKNKKHVIFDYNGTILSDTQICVDALNHLLATQNILPLTVDEYRQKFHFPITEFYKELGFNFSKISFDELGIMYYKIYSDNMHKCLVYDGLIDLVKNLKKEGIRTSILTALNQNELLKQLTYFKLENLFDVTFGLGDYNAHSKIQRGHELMEHVGIAPHDTIMIGDTCHDWEVAQALGIEVLLLSDGHQTHERLLLKSKKVLSLDRDSNIRI